MRAGRPAPQLREELAVLRHRLLIDCVNHERRDLRMRKFLVNSYGESMATKLKFIRLKIEDELIQPVNNLADIRDELKADIASEIVEWYLNQRKAGHVHIRYFSSPKGSDYQGIWFHPDTIKRAKQQAEDDQQPLNRLIYTALARYFEQSI